METKFQNSFIPKKNFAGSSSSPVNLGISPSRPKTGSNSIFLDIAIVIFVLSLASIGGVYFWKTSLISTQEQYKKDLEDRQKKFDPTLITRLKAVNTQIDNAQKILNNHIAISNVFDFISKMTIESVRFISLDISGGGQGSADSRSSEIKILLNGYSANMKSLAFQSDVLGKLAKYDLDKSLKNPILSEPVEMKETGVVLFGLQATIDPNSILYTKNSTQSNSNNQ